MNIKRIITVLFLFNVILSAGCTDDLDIVQNNRITASNMWQEPGDVTSAVNGAYTYLRTSFKTNIIYWGEYRNGLWGPGTRGVLINNDQASVASGTMNANSAYASWTDLYTTINQVNLIIKYTGNMQINQATKDAGLSHAHFIRAFCYFWIGRIWGDAPLSLEGFESTSQDLYLARSPQSEIFKQVEADLNATTQYLKTTGGNKAMLTPDALAMLKADFGLWMYSVQKSGDAYLTLAESAVQSLNLAPAKLETNYADVFSATNKKGKEIIFAMHQENGESTGGFASEHLWNRSYLQTQHINTTVPIGDNQWWVYKDSYINNFIKADPADKRAPVTYGNGPYGTNNAEVGWANKFTGQMISGTRILNSDVIVYRYAQGYLFDAEIKYLKKNYAGALSALGAITNRAYGNATYYTNQAPDAVLNAVVAENLKELASEGHTWWTLIRTDKVWDYNPSLASQKTKKNILLWPITQSAMNRNHKLTQTEGWLGQ